MNLIPWSHQKVAFSIDRSVGTHTYVYIMYTWLLLLVHIIHFKWSHIFVLPCFSRKHIFFDWYMFRCLLFVSGSPKKGPFMVPFADAFNHATLGKMLGLRSFFSIRLIPKAKCFSASMVPFLRTLPKTNIAPENRPSQRTLVFQPSICRCYVSFRECRWFEEINKLKCDLKCLGWIKKTCLCCRFVPYTFSETKPQMVPMDLNIGFQGLAAWFSAKSTTLLPGWWFQTFFVHPYLGNHLSWRAYFSDWLKPPTGYFSWLEDVQSIWFIYYQRILTSMTSWYSIIGACFGLCRMSINCNKSRFQLARFLVQNRLTLQNRSKIDLVCV